MAKEPLAKQLEEEGMKELFDKIEMPLVYTLSDMEKEGIAIDADALKEYGENLAVSIDKIEKEIYEEAGETFNINSPKQLGVILLKIADAKWQEDQDRIFYCSRCTGKAGTGLSDCIKNIRVPSADQIKIHICRRTGCIYCRGWTDSQYIPADHNSHRTFKQYRPEFTEHSNPDGIGTADS